jgi:hypothetical protein
VIMGLSDSFFPHVARVGPTTPKHSVGVRFGLLSHQEPSRALVVPTSPIAPRPTAPLIARIDQPEAAPPRKSQDEITPDPLGEIRKVRRRRLRMENRRAIPQLGRREDRPSHAVDLVSAGPPPKGSLARLPTALAVRR